MRRFALICFLLATAQALAQYTLTDQQPATVASYSSNAKSVTTKPLPSDVMSHCYGNTSNCSAGDAIAQCAMTDCGNLSETGQPTYMGSFVKASPGHDDFGTPVYYAASTDPWYSITASTPTGPQSITFQAPNAATLSEGDEHVIGIWDQATGWVVQIYSGASAFGILSLPTASGCGSTQATACPITAYFEQSAATNLFAAQDYGYTGGGGTETNASNGVAPLAATTRELELQNGAINHAIMLTVDCVNSVTPFVFPANQNPGTCGSSGQFGPQNANRPSAGQLFFLDYTAAQIASFNLPAWQATVLTAISKYGAYISETQGLNTGFSLVGDENLESSEAWKYYYGCPGCTTNDPFWTWILTQKGLNGIQPINGTAGCTSGSSGTNPSLYRCIGAFLANIPRTLGPEGSDAEGNSCTTGSGCYPSGHIHVADPCVVVAAAGLSSSGSWTACPADAAAPMITIGGSPPASLTKDSQGNFVALVTITNTGNVTVTSAQVTTTGTTLGSASLLSAPPPITNLAPGDSATVTLTFPSSAVSSTATTAHLEVSGTYSVPSFLLSGDWVLSFRGVSLY